MRIRGALVKVLERLNAHAGTAARSAQNGPRGRNDGRTIPYLRGQLAALEQDERTLLAMLGRRGDSFHHTLAAGTTAHLDGVRARIDDLRLELEQAEGDLTAEGRRQP